MLIDVFNVHSPRDEENLNEILNCKEAKEIKTKLGIKTLPKIVANPIGLPYKNYYKLANPSKLETEFQEKKVSDEAKNSYYSVLRKAADASKPNPRTKFLPIFIGGRGDYTKGHKNLVADFIELSNEHKSYFEANGISLICQMQH